MNEKTVLGNSETLKHIYAVRALLFTIIKELDHRAQVHDQSKLESPESEIFGEYTPQLEVTEYGTDAYNDLLEKVKPALDHHYAKNRHHPQHWPNGINDMTLIDLIEMLCDWKASSERNKNGNLRQTIDHNAERFEFSDQLRQIFENTLREHLGD